MVVGVDGPVAPLGTAQKLVGAVGDHLVGVHVGRGAGPGLEHVYDKLIVPDVIGDLLCRLTDRFGQLAIQQSKIGVYFSRGTLDRAEGGDERRVSAVAADGEILHRARCLHPVIGIRGHLFLAQRISLDPHIRPLHPVSLPHCMAEPSAPAGPGAKGATHPEPGCESPSEPSPERRSSPTGASAPKG